MSAIIRREIAAGLSYRIRKDGPPFSPWALYRSDPTLQWVRVATLVNWSAAVYVMDCHAWARATVTAITEEVVPA